jgi:hypothetical protein
MLKLSKLPDRTPVKITFSASPDLNRALHAYADLYRETYGEAETVPELIPYMLEGFLKNDPAFSRIRRTPAPGKKADRPAESDSNTPTSTT